MQRIQCMPERQTVKRAKRDLRKGRAPSTAAGEFVREEIDHIREGKHGARSTKQAIAIGLSKARRAGVKLGKPPARRASSTRAKSGRRAVSHDALSRQAKSAARRRSASSRSAAARRAARTRRRRRAAAA
jgi:hypothetical protein